MSDELNAALRALHLELALGILGLGGLVASFHTRDDFGTVLAWGVIVAAIVHAMRRWYYTARPAATTTGKDEGK